MVSAWACQNGVVLSQQKTDAKSNEITAIPQLLDILELKGCIVTIDAMGCQRDIAKKIRECEADYVLALKCGHQDAIFSQHGAQKICDVYHCKLTWPHAFGQSYHH